MLYDWQKAFVHAIETKDIIILHGNIRDIYTVDAGKIHGPAADLQVAITAILHGCCTKYTPVFQLDGPISDLGPEVQEDWVTAIIHDIQPSFSNEPPITGGREATIPELAKRINRLPEGDKIVISIRSDRMLPVAVYLNNPRVRLIHVTPPGPEQRHAFIYKKTFSTLTIDNMKNRRIPWLISRLTAGMTLRDIDVALDFIPEYLGKELSQCKEGEIETAVYAFKFPDYVDYYKTIPLDPPEGNHSLRSLHTAVDFFMESGYYPGGESGGPAEAAQAVTRMIETIRTGVCRLHSRDIYPDRPKGVLFFCGPRGTDKNKTAGKIAEFIFNDREAVIHFDLAARRKDAAVIGLIKKIREKPFSVIIMHNITKAVPRLLEIAETILRKGRTTDYAGETVYFSQTVVIFVSDLGARSHSLRGNGGRPHTEKQELENLIEQSNREDVVDNKVRQSAIKEHFYSCVERFFREEIYQPHWLGLIGHAVVSFWFPSSRAGIMSCLRSNLKRMQSDFSSIYAEQNLKLEIDIEGLVEMFYKKYNTQFRQLGPDIIDFKVRNTILPRLASFLTHLPEDQKFGRTIRMMADQAGQLAVE